MLLCLLSTSMGLFLSPLRLSFSISPCSRISYLDHHLRESLRGIHAGFNLHRAFFFFSFACVDVL